MKTIIAILNWFGLFTKNQINKLDSTYKKLFIKFSELYKENTRDKIYIKELIKTNKSIPFQFDYLIGMYSKDQLNALAYKMINFARNKSEFRDLLDIWIERLNNAKNSLNG